MARPKQRRLVNKVPGISGLRPYGCYKSKKTIELQYDEYEALRLLDYEGMQQEHAAQIMNVSRPTLTRIYNMARKNIAQALVEGCNICIAGGNADFSMYQNQKINYKIMNQKIAIPTAEGNLWPHFGKAPQVTIVTIEEGEIKESVVLEAPEHAHGAMPRFIQAQKCTDVLCGGLGGGAVEMLNKMGIQVHAGAPSIKVEDVVKQYLDGSIVYGDGTCHHDGCGNHHQDKA
jgi:predicted DNA-binding protein (UPF0251 family)/predicted Fe-Mo cluster-binding NifX family protein